MSYDHSLDADILLNPGTTQQALEQAFLPLLEYFDWHVDQFFTNTLPDFDESIEFDRTGADIRGITLHLCGEVRDEYETVLDRFADNLTHLAKVGWMVHKNFSDGNLDDAITRIWYGPAEDIAKEKKLLACREAIELLEEADVAPSVVLAVQTLLATSMAEL